MNAELIAVGTELLLGDTINTDAAAVARLLSELGINVYWQTVVGDNRARLEQAVQLARTRADLIITTGGLGPTCDDLTKEVVAGAFGIPLELNKAEEDRLRGLYRERGIYMTENHLQQVMLPRGCTVLQNDWGTAPACAFEADGCLVIMLPGPPLECEPLLRYRVRPLLAARGDGIIVSHSVKIFGIGEGTMEYQLRDLMNEMQNPTLAPYAKEGECLVRVTAKAPTEAEAEAMIAPCVARVQRELGAFAYGVDTLNIETCAAELLLAQHKTIAVADSCTGGLLGDLLTNVPGASAAFSGGIIAYNDETRSACWMLTRAHRALRRRQPRGAAMAEHVRAAFGTDLALSITALPAWAATGAHRRHALQALATPDGTFHRTLHRTSGAACIKHAAANHAFDMVWRYLTGLPVEFEKTADAIIEFRGRGSCPGRVVTHA
ncbi:MAG: CinA family nicotinamide mononucleotide deamidase-related protein [Oscillospiraceae bacterium]